jgi:hypothetical protein
MLGQVPSDEIGVVEKKVTKLGSSKKKWRNWGRRKKSDEIGVFALRNLHYLKVFMNMLIFYEKFFKSIDVNFHVANWNSFFFLKYAKDLHIIVLRLKK